MINYVYPQNSHNSDKNIIFQSQIPYKVKLGFQICYMNYLAANAEKKKKKSYELFCIERLTYAFAVPRITFMRASQVRVPCWRIPP